MNMVSDATALSQWWGNNGTKTLGVLVAGIGTALALNKITATYVPWAQWLTVVLGAVVFKRGFTKAPGA
jgi:hypothetical protein